MEKRDLSSAGSFSRGGHSWVPGTQSGSPAWMAETLEHEALSAAPEIHVSRKLDQRLSWDSTPYTSLLIPLKSQLNCHLLKGEALNLPLWVICYLWPLPWQHKVTVLNSVLFLTELWIPWLETLNTFLTSVFAEDIWVHEWIITVLGALE